MTKFSFIKVTGINGFEFFVGTDSVIHDYAKMAKSIGVKWSEIKSDYDHADLVENIDKATIFAGTVNKEKLATDKQQWCLQRHIVNTFRNPIYPIEGITIEMCA